MLQLDAMIKPFQTMHNGRIQWAVKWKQDGKYHYVYDDNKKRALEKQLIRIAKLNTPVITTVKNKSTSVDSHRIKTIDAVFHERIEAINISDKYYSVLNGIYNNHVHDAIGITDITKCDAALLTNYFNELNTTDSTKNKIYKLLHAVFEYAINKNYITNNPIDRINKPTYVNKTRVREIDKQDSIILTIMGIIAYLSNEECKWHELYPIILMLTLGLRASELTGLTRESINDAEQTIKIDTQLRKGNGRYYLKLGTKGTKDKYNTRTIPLPKQYYLALKEYMRTHKNDETLSVYFNDELIDDNRHLLFTKHGQPVDYNWLRTHWLRIQHDYHALTHPTEPMTKNDYIRLHAFRHATATIMAMQGENIQTVQAIMGHMDKQMTEYYTHLTATMMTDTMNRLRDNIMNDNIKNYVNETMKLKSTYVD